MPSARLLVGGSGWWNETGSGRTREAREREREGGREGGREEGILLPPPSSPRL